MADGSLSIDFGQELVVDLFAGGGGASTGIARAYRAPDVAVNHDPIAIAVHRANHPHTDHYQEDVFHVDPITATRGRPVGLLWASPDCRHHSKAKGAAPRSKRVRALAWVVVRWALATAPRVIEIENVEEFIKWGPLDADGKPIKEQEGETFRAFIAAMTTGLAADHPAMAEIMEFLGESTPVAALVRGLHYTADWREIRACNKGTPTIRKRLVVKFRRDGRPITWSADTHGAKGRKGAIAGKLKPWRSAAECIDWSLPNRSIFGRKKSLATNTCRRLARGLWRYVLACEQPFIVPHAIVVDGELRHAPIAPYLTEFANASKQRCFSVDEPLRTQCAQVKGGHFALVAAHLLTIGYGERAGQAARVQNIAAPLGTVVGARKHAVAAAFFEQANGGFYDGDGRSALDPFSTICTSGANQRMVTAYLVKYYGSGGQWQGMDEPMHTVPTRDRMGMVQAVHLPAGALTDEQLAGARRCAAFLHKHLPEQFPQLVDAVLVGDLVLVDITLRMLVPRELARAQGFTDSYIIDRGLFETSPGSGEYEWRPVTKTDQVRLLGNAVCPDMAEAEVRNDLADLIEFYRQQEAA